MNFPTAYTYGVYINWYDIPELVVPIMVYLIERKLLNQGFLEIRLNHHFESFTYATMTRLTAMEYLWHKWSRICSAFRNQNLVLSSLITYHCICNMSNTTGATCGAGTSYPSGAHEFPPVLSGVRDAGSLNLCVVLCRSLFVLFLLAIVLFVLCITDSDYLFGIFKLLIALCTAAKKWSKSRYRNLIILPHITSCF